MIYLYLFDSWIQHVSNIICIIFPCSTMFRTLIPICLRCFRWLEPRGLLPADSTWDVGEYVRRLREIHSWSQLFWKIWARLRADDFLRLAEVMSAWHGSLSLTCAEDMCWRIEYRNYMKLYVHQVWPWMDSILILIHSLRCLATLIRSDNTCFAEVSRANMPPVASTVWSWYQPASGCSTFNAKFARWHLAVPWHSIGGFHKWGYP